MRRLAIIPNDPIDLYLSAGYSANWLKAYFNPARFFDEVYSLAPYERVDGSLVGVTVMPTPPEELSHRLRELKIDIVRAYGGSHPCAIACRDKASGVPVVVSVHDALSSMLDRSIEDADIVLCVSETVKRLVATKFKTPDRLWLLPNRVDFSEMRSDESHEFADLDAKYPFKHKILHLGRKVWEKNLDNLIRALRLLGPDYCVLASGKGAPTEYARIAAEEGVLDRCFFIDSIPNDRLARYFSWADCMCTPSRSEGFGMVFIEALASGAMVVGSDIPAISELINHRENGLLIKDYENPAAIADVVRVACTDHGVRRTSMGNARRSVEKFERSRIEALEAAYYQKVLDLRAVGAFVVPLGKRIRQSVESLCRPLSRLC